MDIQKLWIIHREIGICIFEQSFENLPTDLNSDLIGGFLVAILSFSNEVADQDIDYLQLKKLRILYHISEQYIIAVAFGNDVKIDKIDSALNKVEEKFNSKYHNVLENFSGDVAVFYDFAEDVEAIFESKSIEIKINTAKDQVREFLENKKTVLTKSFIEAKQMLFGENEKTETKLFEKVKSKYEETSSQWEEKLYSMTEKINESLEESKEKMERIKESVVSKLSSVKNVVKQKFEMDSDKSN